MIPETYHVEKISGRQTIDFVKRHHYSRGCHNGPMGWGLFDADQLIGAIAFATPSSENVRASVFGPEYKNAVTELHRLVILDSTPTNTESWFIARSLKALHQSRPCLRGVLSFADSTEGHIGTIYQASNALYCGMTSATMFYRDETGRLRHPRQSGRNITMREAKERGWSAERRSAKYRYLFLIGSGADRKAFRQKLRLDILPYPKAEMVKVA